MKRFLGILIKSILGLALVLGLGVLALSFFVNPERLKPYAISFMQDKYQRTLSMGDVSWNIFPKLGLSIHDVSLGNNPNFGDATFAAVKTVRVFVDTLSLLRGQVNVNNVEVIDVEANIQTNENGVNSWDDFAQSSSAQAEKTATVDQPEDNSNSKGKGSDLAISDLSFNIEKIEIQNGQFNYKDDKAGSTYNISDLSFQAENVSLDQAFPVALSFGLKSTVPAVTAKVHAKVNLTVGMKNGAFDPDSMMLEGHVEMPSLTMQNIKISALKAPVKIANNVVNLNGMSAHFYGGHLGGSAKIDRTAVPSQISVNYDLKGVQMGPMLKDMGGKDTITGTLTMKGNVSFKTAGQKKQMMQSLNGKSQMSLKNGVLKGVDLAYYYAMGSNLINPKNLIPSRKNAGQTDFSTSTAHFTLTKGVLSNPDFVILNSGIYGSGSGTVNLVSEQVNYRFRIQGAQQGSKGTEPVGTAIPVQITGNMNNPNISLDIGASLVEGVKQGVLQGLGSRVPGSQQGSGSTTTQKGIGGQIFKALGM